MNRSIFKRLDKQLCGWLPDCSKRNQSAERDCADQFRVEPVVHRNRAGWSGSASPDRASSSSQRCSCHPAGYSGAPTSSQGQRSRCRVRCCGHTHHVRRSSCTLPPVRWLSLRTAFVRGRSNTPRAPPTLYVSQCASCRPRSRCPMCRWCCPLAAPCPSSTSTVVLRPGSLVRNWVSERVLLLLLMQTFDGVRIAAPSGAAAVWKRS